MKKSSFFASILVAFVFLAASSAEAYRLEKEWSKSFDTRDGVSFTLENTNGPVEIEGWEKDRVEVRARIKIKAPSKSSALRVAEKLLTSKDQNMVHDLYLCKFIIWKQL